MEKPYQEIKEIVTSMINSPTMTSTIRIYQPQRQQDVALGGDDIIFILDGTFEICNQKSNMVLGEVGGPYILKIIPDVFSENYVFTEKSSFSYFTCPRRIFYAHIDHHNLWRSLLEVLSYSTWLLYQHMEVMKMDNLYDVVKHYLNKIEQDPELMRRENICHYITSRTGYSRSGVMTIIRELKKGAYIDVEKGKLLWVKTLPLKF